jgi:hypothetical protein
MVRGARRAGGPHASGQRLADEAGQHRLNPVRMADAAGYDGCACEPGSCCSEGKARNYEESARRLRGLRPLRVRETGVDAIFHAQGRYCGAELPQGFVDAAVVILAGVCDV